MAFIRLSGSHFAHSPLGAKWQFFAAETREPHNQRRKRIADLPSIHRGNLDDDAYGIYDAPWVVMGAPHENESNDSGRPGESM